jgi:predicted nucleic acid-binding Zn ribbon protein
MPIYTYKCPCCENTVEVSCPVSRMEEDVPVCTCKEGHPMQMDRVVMPSTFLLKGGCWARDSYHDITKGIKR